KKLDRRVCLGVIRNGINVSQLGPYWLQRGTIYFQKSLHRFRYQRLEIVPGRIACRLIDSENAWTDLDQRPLIWAGPELLPYSVGRHRFGDLGRWEFNGLRITIRYLAE